MCYTTCYICFILNLLNLHCYPTCTIHGLLLSPLVAWCSMASLEPLEDLFLRLTTPFVTPSTTPRYLPSVAAAPLLS